LAALALALGPEHGLRRLLRRLLELRGVARAVERHVGDPREQALHAPGGLVRLVLYVTRLRLDRALGPRRALGQVVGQRDRERDASELFKAGEERLARPHLGEPAQRADASPVG